MSSRDDRLVGWGDLAARWPEFAAAACAWDRDCADVLEFELVVFVREPMGKRLCHREALLVAMPPGEVPPIPSRALLGWCAACEAWTRGHGPCGRGCWYWYSSEQPGRTHMAIEIAGDR